ncbi:hypothetical protein IEQ34_025018 [Dendrobium chrysotoxum]|uniref:Uncharacterized protein n=1 Tax=Dendrobium chrysotoxum TaxID=161865 RepID=A0AAV7FRX4_DENCH|nr:hypothetical protein IEQ34_025018 [Dendrobium chrysotoxum]
MALLYLTPVFNGVCSFFFGGVCQYDLNEVRGFASDIRWAFLCGSQRPGGFVACNKPLRPKKTSGRWSRGAFGEG